MIRNKFRSVCLMASLSLLALPIGAFAQNHTADTYTPKPVTPTQTQQDIKFKQQQINDLQQANQTRRDVNLKDYNASITSAQAAKLDAERKAVGLNKPYYDQVAADAQKTIDERNAQINTVNQGIADNNTATKKYDQELLRFKSKDALEQRLNPAPSESSQRELEQFKADQAARAQALKDKIAADKAASDAYIQKLNEEKAARAAALQRQLEADRLAAQRLNRLNHGTGTH